MKEIKATVSGKVQGVFFRQFVKSTAEFFSIVGEVLNREDGTVFVVAQGDEETLKSFIRALWQGSRASEVQDVSVEWGEVEEQYNDFNITG